MVWLLGSLLNMMVYPAVILTDKYAGGNLLGFGANLVISSHLVFENIHHFILP
jgi:hypothetical protein